jgi:threonine dehydratase
MTPPSVSLPLSAIEEARAVLRRHLPASPCLAVHDGADRVGRLLVKAENLLPTGSFKIRGATFRLSLLSAEERRRGVIAYSTGNHAQAVAKAARDIGTQAIIVMSPDVPALKIEATQRWGATVLMAEPSSHARRAMAERIAARRELVLVPPYDDLAIMAGQGTIGLEILDQLPGADDLTVYVPVGGGGLLAGVAAALKQARLKQARPGIRVIGVEPEMENDAFQSFRAGRLIGLEAPSGSIADAIKVQQLGDLTWPLIRHYVDDIETVSETEIAAASQHCFSVLKMVVEPGGAAGFAAAARAADGQQGSALALLCGGNVTLKRLQGLHIEAAS